MAIFTTSLQHRTGSSSQCGQARKINKSHPYWKRNKAVFIMNDMISYIEKPKNTPARTYK